MHYPPPSSLPPGSKCVAYLRDSGGTDQEDSVERQEMELRTWCATYGIELTTIYADEARTARRDVHKRKDLLSMMAHFRNGGEEVGVIIWNYERFARNAKHGRTFIAELDSLNKTLVSLTDYIPEGPERHLFQEIKLYSAEMTSSKISVDVSSGLRRMVDVHKAMPGTPPRGIRRGAPIQIGIHRDGSPRIVHKWEPDPDLKNKVHQAFQMRAHGATVRHIQKETGLYNNNNSWTTFFSNPLYKGTLVYGDLVIDNYCEAIVPAELWDAANAVSKRRGLARVGDHHHPHRVNSEYLLSSLVFCQVCGSPMNGHTFKRWHYYACSRHLRRHDCPARHVPREAIENGVIEALLDQVLTLESLLNIQSRLQASYDATRETVTAERLVLDRKLRAAKKEISNLVKAIKNNPGSRALHKSLNEAELEESEIRVQLTALELSSQPPPHLELPALARMAEWLSDHLRNGTLEEKKFLLHNIVTRIVVRRGDTEIMGFVYYLPPQQQITLAEKGEGNLVYGRVPPRSTVNTDQIVLFIPVKKHKAPLPK